MINTCSAHSTWCLPTSFLKRWLLWRLSKSRCVVSVIKCPHSTPLATPARSNCPKTWPKTTFTLHSLSQNTQLQSSKIWLVSQQLWSGITPKASQLLHLRTPRRWTTMLWSQHRAESSGNFATASESRSQWRQRRMVTEETLPTDDPVHLLASPPTVCTKASDTRTLDRP